MSCRAAASGGLMSFASGTLHFCWWRKGPTESLAATSGPSYYPGLICRSVLPACFRKNSRPTTHAAGWVGWGWEANLPQWWGPTPNPLLNQCKNTHMAASIWLQVCLVSACGHAVLLGQWDCLGLRAGSLPCSCSQLYLVTSESPAAKHQLPPGENPLAAKS